LACVPRPCSFLYHEPTIANVFWSGYSDSNICFSTVTASLNITALPWLK
jgi:hypothetical protein